MRQELTRTHRDEKHGNAAAYNLISVHTVQYSHFPSKNCASISILLLQPMQLNFILRWWARVDRHRYIYMILRLYTIQWQKLETMHGQKYWFSFLFPSQHNANFTGWHTFVWLYMFYCEWFHLISMIIAWFLPGALLYSATRCICSTIIERNNGAGRWRLRHRHRWPWHLFRSKNVMFQPKN